MRSFDKFEELLPNIKNDSFYIWGTGNTAQLCQEGIKREYINILGYIDSNQAKWGTEFNGKPVISPMQYKKQQEPVLICSAQKEVYDEIKEQVSSWGGQSFNFDAFIFARHKIELRQVYELLEDERSRDVFTEVLSHRLTWEPMEEEYVSDKQYFAIREFSLHRNTDVFVDCGAFVGDTIEQYVWQMCGVFKKIIAFEIDARNFKCLQKRIARLRDEWNLADEDIETCRCGIGKGDYRAFVSQYNDNNGLGSKICAEPAEKEDSIEMVSLDSFFANRQDKITFIKADIESYEYNMLLGAKNVIREHKPRIAVCIYHNPTDMYSIPLLLKEINPEYHFELRHHSYGVEEDTVLYAYI